MTVTVKRIQSTDTHAWDTYVYNHPHATLYHLSGWKNVIERTYGHKTYYLMAVQSDDLSGSLVLQPNNLNNATNPINPKNPTNPINPV
ncbi:MAG: hypothetical protein ACNY01_14685, partial [Desulfobacteria bacterium]